MNLDDFAACLSRIKIMNGKINFFVLMFTTLNFLFLDTFEKHSRGGSKVTLSKDEFFKITLDA